MRRIPNLLLGGLFGLLIFSACASAGGPVTPARVPTALPSPTIVETLTFPTPIPPGEAITWDTLHVTMDRAEAGTTYTTDYGSQRVPPAGSKFLWVHIRLDNSGLDEQPLPAVEHFSILYSTSEFKSTYGHRKGYPDYTTLPVSLYQGQEVDAWLRFDIPADSKLEDLQFAFLPESLQVSTSFSATVSPWGEHPIYLWNCAP